MKLGLTKETLSYGVPVFQSILETAQGGFTLNESVLAANSEVRAGTVIGFDETTRIAKIAKVAVNKNASGTSDVTYEVYKGHNLAVGMSVKIEGGTAQAITGIDTSNANHDVVTVGTTLSGSAVAAGAAIFVDDDGYRKAGGLLVEDTTVTGNQTLSVAIRATVYENRIVPVPDVLKTVLKHIVFSKSY